ncbi:nicotinate-nucleotide adenylyltransferase [Spiroplasma poulsonii]|uniref:Probable nicotinate-nucleotide adenylyltransferase n=1 Tax=Spiroplasma poulsonii TaxID=2138 RepID=A0A3S0TX82_9MOLU|nr:nicotinate-nucleotide adenylyltransferase [Spiroplasma poulsonii]MBW3058687.1 nicotinate (nicotinamide) nucleotide adenylyltransferase [Spiroplasma poulsonii]RUP76132.1 nicotinate-nucleotide adenylyltransferase [Spiroplasma poulsonii]
MKIALFGGSFDPFHTDHLAIIKLVKAKTDIDQVWIIPTNQNPFKTRKLSPVSDRLAMIKLVVSKLSYVKINLIELENTKPSTTYNTVLKLHQQFPTYQFYFMIGSDQLQTLGKWNNIAELIKMQTFIIFQRNEQIKQTILQQYQALLIPFTNNLHLSSTMLREGEKVALQLPAITNYVNNNLLYLPERLGQKMDPERYQHCLNVGKKAQELALRYGLDPHKALIAGTYHDITKQWPKEKQEAYLEKYLPSFLTEPVPTWHSYTGYCYLKYDLLFIDKEILSAIKWHTVGHPQMTLFEMIIFIADKISAERNYPGVESYRALAQQDLTKAFQALLTMQFDRAVMQTGLAHLGRKLKLTYQEWKRGK